MIKLVAFITGSIAGSVVWWLTDDFGFMTAFFASTVATGFGMYYGAKLARERLT